MTQYIDKDTLVAEIEKIKTDALQKKSQCKRRGLEKIMRQIGAYNKVLSFLDTLEVAEVDINKEISQFIDANFEKATIGHKLSLRRTAKYFFELGLKAKDWEKERMEECPYRQVGCTMYEGKILKCRGACSWVVDYLKSKELKAQKGDNI